MVPQVVQRTWLPDFRSPATPTVVIMVVRCSAERRVLNWVPPHFGQASPLPPEVSPTFEIFCFLVVGGFGMLTGLDGIVRTLDGELACADAVCAANAARSAAR